VTRAPAPDASAPPLSFRPPHPPRPLLTRPRPFYGASAGADHPRSLTLSSGQNSVLVPCCDQLPKQPILLARLSPHSLRLRRVVPVLPVGPARPLQSLWRARSGARSTVHATSPVRHRGPVTGAAVPTPCSAARGSVRTVETFAAGRFAPPRSGTLQCHHALLIGGHQSADCTRESLGLDVHPLAFLTCHIGPGEAEKAGVSWQVGANGRQWASLTFLRGSGRAAGG
jgi:hypothetical protein